MAIFDCLYEAVSILAEGDDTYTLEEIRAVLEDAQSPVTTKYTENLFKSVINKGHIDFGDIPKSKGNIKNYSGYQNMVDTLYNIRKLGEDNRTSSVIDVVNTIDESIKNIEVLSPIFEKGYRNKNEYVMMEYNTFVYCCIEATTAVLCEFVDFIKKPSSQTMEITLKNTRYRANLFYVEQLKKFNKVNSNMSYRKFLEQMIDKGSENFIGTAEVVGMTAIISVALAIVPVTRELIYHFYNTRRKLSDALLVQAYFLEINKAVVEANTNFTAEQKEKILKKQEHLRTVLVKLADKIKVSNVKADRDAKKDISNDNKKMSVDSQKKEVEDSPLVLL